MSESQLDYYQVRRGLDRAAIKKDFEDHLNFTLVKDQYSATDYDKYLALSYTIRDRLIDRWAKTQKVHHTQKAKRVYYLSLEFLMGRVLGNNIANLQIEDEVRAACKELEIDLNSLENLEMDMGLGNGGLGRLAACFLDSLASLEIPAIGYGIRYNFGIFRQEIKSGCQVEQPDDWLKFGNPWEIPRPQLTFEVHFGGKVDNWTDESGRPRARWVRFPRHHRPSLRHSHRRLRRQDRQRPAPVERPRRRGLRFRDFNKGDYISAVESKVAART